MIFKTMDYKEKVIALLNSQELSKEQKEKLESIFPELAESEDERIRKKLITFFQRFPYTNLYDASLNAKDVLAWLEKQNEQKPVNDTDEDIVEAVKDTSILDMVEPKFKIGDTIIKKHNSDINTFGQFTITDIAGGKYWYNDRIICDISEQYEWELVEQKPISFDTSTPVLMMIFHLE